jgi:hypothetical protein
MYRIIEHEEPDILNVIFRFLRGRIGSLSAKVHECTIYIFYIEQKVIPFLHCAEQPRATEF